MAKRNSSGLLCSLAAAAVGLAIFASIPESGAASLNVGGDASNTGGSNSGAASASFSGDDGTTSTGTATFGNSPNRTTSTAAFGSGSNGATTATNFNNNSGQTRVGANSGSTTETATATFGTSPDEAGFTSSLGTGPMVGPDIGAVTAAGVTGAIGQLSIGEQQKLMRKCTSVLAAPKRYDSDVVSLCKVIASL